MRTGTTWTWGIIAACLLGLGATASAQLTSQPADTPNRRFIYDSSASAERAIAFALTRAKRDHKRVLLQFGVNSSDWCQRLHELFSKDKDVARELLYEYIVVMVESGKVDGKQNNQAVIERYGNPIKHGFPVLVVLDEHGQYRTTQETGSFEAGNRHDPAKVLAFLKKWQATPPPAEEALSAAVAEARSKSKAVLVQFSAPWCGWCRRYDDFQDGVVVATILDHAYASVKIDVDRMAGGKALCEKLGGKTAGLPFFVVLDADGKKVADSIGPGGNVGFPAKPEEVEHFLKMIRETAPKLNDYQIGALRDALSDRRLRTPPAE